MKNLIFFCNTFTYKLDHTTLVAEKYGEVGDFENFKDVLVVFSTVESSDTSGITTEVAKDIRKIARKNGSKIIVINPFAHLSSSLASPESAIKILNEISEKINKENEFTVKRLHFGWYKEFDFNISGKENTQIFREY